MYTGLTCVTSTLTIVPRPLVQKGAGAGDGLLQPEPLDRDPLGECAAQPGRHHRVEKDEDAAIVGSPHQPAERLLEPQPGQAVIVPRPAEGPAPRLVQQ